ncbi:MAG: sigma-70 family RNA polymerase sigma factor [Byssovorax sp.]
MAGAREEIEREIQSWCERGDLLAAATAAIRGYGPEIFGLLLALHRDHDHASDVFSIFSEDLWKGIGHFAWQCSFRTWAYTLARNASCRYRKNERKRAHDIPLSLVTSISAIQAEARSETSPHLRSDNKRRIEKLREELSEEDQTLLILRVDKELAWSDLARVMLGERDLSADEAELKRESARLRKRFQLIKERLVELGRKEGLLR